MKSILEKIQWDYRENPGDYSIHYRDRFNDQLLIITFKEIQHIKDGFMLVYDGEEYKNIPVHRVRKIYKNEDVIFER